MRTLLIAVVLSFGCIADGVAAEPARSEAAKAVLVTGASTGIGRYVTERSGGEGLLRLRRRTQGCGSGRAQRHQERAGLASRRHASRKTSTRRVATITKAGRGLYGLVNNAGVATPGLLADTSMRGNHLQMQVNVYGPVRVTQAFAAAAAREQGTHHQYRIDLRRARAQAT